MQPRDPGPSREEVLSHADLESTYRMEQQADDDYLARVLKEVPEMRELVKGTLK